MRHAMFFTVAMAFLLAGCQQPAPTAAEKPTAVPAATKGVAAAAKANDSTGVPLKADGSSTPPPTTGSSSVTGASSQSGSVTFGEEGSEVTITGKEGEKISVKTKVGETVVYDSKLSEGMKGFPVPDGFKENLDGAASISASSGQKMDTGIWTGTASLQSVSDYYKKAMAEQGWKQEMVLDMGEAAQLIYSKEKEQAVVTISKEGDKTTITAMVGNTQ